MRRGAAANDRTQKLREEPPPLVAPIIEIEPADGRPRGRDAPAETYPSAPAAPLSPFELAPSPPIDHTTICRGCRRS